MKKVSGVSVLLLAGTFVMSPAANAATVLTAKNGMTVYVFDKDEGGALRASMPAASNGHHISPRAMERWKRAGQP
jgi:predicted lipoprotein with Yx(FWY)xxD motif